MNNIQDSKNILNIGGNFVVQGDVIVGDGAQKVQLASTASEILPSDYLKELPEIASNIKFPNQPFIGLRWFTRADARIFFGRGKIIKTLYDLLNTPTSDDLILLYGQSGVGKSSLLHAGLFPRLEQDWSVVYERRNQETLISEALEKRLSNIPNDAKSLVIIDQLEEVLTVPNVNTSEELILLQKFIQKTQETRPNIKWIASFRKEFVAEMEITFQNLAFTKLFVPPLQREGIIEAVLGITTIEGAKQKYQLTIEEGLAEKIASDIFRDQSSHIAPALQVLLTKFWEKAKQKNPNTPHFNHKDYEEFVRENGLLLDEFLEEQLKKIAVRYLDSGLALDVLQFYTTPLATATEHSQQELFDLYAHLPQEELKALITKFKDLYLLTDNRDDDHQRLAHDALAPLVIQRYTNSITKGQRARSLLENRIKNSPKEKLIALNAADLKIVEAGKGGMRVWTAREQELVENSLKNIRRQKIIRNSVLGVLGVLLLATIVLLFRDRQNKLAEIAQGKVNILKYQAENAANPTIQYQHYQEILALEDQDQSTKDKLYESYRENIFYEDQSLSNGNNDFGEVAISSDGTQWAIAYKNGEEYRIDCYTYDLERGNLIYQNSINEATSASLKVLQFSADGQNLFGGGNDHILHRWDALGKDFPSDPLGGDRKYKIEAIDISPDQKWAIASFFDQDVILLYDIDNQKIKRYLNTGQATALKFLGDSDHLAIALSNGKVIEYNLAEDTERVLYESDSKVNVIAYNDRDDYLVIGKEDGAFALGGKRTLRFYDNQKHKEGITAIKFSKDYNFLLTASKDQTATLWRTDPSTSLFLLYDLVGHQGAVNEVGFSKDQRKIFTIADKVRFWDLPPISPLQTINSYDLFNSAHLNVCAISVHDNLVFGATNRNGIVVWEISTGEQKTGLLPNINEKITAIEADESLIAGGDENGEIYFWQSNNQALLDSFSDIHQASIRNILFSEQHIAILAEDKTISIWNKQNRNHLSTLQHTANVIDMSFSWDGNTLYSISAAGKLQAWSLANFEAEILYENFETDFTHLAYQADKQELVTATSSDSLQFWQLNGEKIAEIPLAANATFMTNISSGQLAVGMEDGRVFILDAARNAYLQLLPFSTAIDLKWHNEKLFVATENGEIQIWQVDRKNPLE